MDIDKVKEILQAAITIKPIEIGCDDCEEKLDEYVTIQLQKKEIDDESLILVKEHLEICKFCNEECLSLLDALNKAQISK